MATATIATTPYRPPLATGSPATPTTIDSGSSTSQAASYAGASTAQPGNTNIYLYYFIVPYLDAHVLSPPSWRYAYILWIFIPVVLIIWSFSHQLSRRLIQPRSYSKQSSIHHHSSSTYNLHPSSYLRGLFIRRLIPTKSTIHSIRPSQIPRWYASNINIGQLVTLITFTIVLLAVSLVGDDYISPTTCTWGGRCPVQVFNQGPPKSTYLPTRRSRRSNIIPHPPRAAQAPRPVTPPLPALISFDHEHVLLPRATALSLNPNGWAPFTDPLLSAPNTDVSRTMWTLSSRFGLIAYALIPFVVSLGLKSWPFNIFAIPYLTHYGFDRTSMIHRWTGRLIWIWSTIHTITFSIQLARDINPYGNMILTDVWKYYRFNWGVVAYLALTITVCFSFNPLRNRYYEFFYCSHVVLSIVFLVGCIIHYEPLWAWAVIGLTLWGAERGFRLMGWLWFNGFFDKPARFWSNDPQTSTYQDPQIDSHTTLQDSTQLTLNALPTHQHTHHYPPSSSTLFSHHLTPSSPHLPPNERDHLRFPPNAPIRSINIPPGFALVQVLPGHTLRLTLKMVKSARWDIGQYLLLCVPSVSWWQTHPYTICGSSTLSDFDQSEQNSSGKEVVLLLRARQGFSKKFYEYVMQVKAEGSRSGQDHLAHGALVRCQISRPLGSSGRIGWDLLDTLVIVCGGSGISFGIAALQETCFKIWSRSNAGMDDRLTSRFKVSRVCLVWIFREYAHLSWVAPALKRCIEMVSSDTLQIHLYVSNSLRRKKRSLVQPTSSSSPPLPSPHSAEVQKSEVTDTQTLLVPPHPAFLRTDSDSDFSASPMRNSFASSMVVTESDHSHDGLESQNVPVEFTDFEGENQQGTDAEMIVSTNVRLESNRRRKNTLRGMKSLKRSQLWNFTKPILGGSGSEEKREASLPDMEKEGMNSITHNDHRQGIVKELMEGGDDEVKLNQSSPTNHQEANLWKQGLMQEIGIDLNPCETLALEELSESIRTGRPKLEKILKTEVRTSLGKTLVACCGPDSLNSYMRNLVSQEYLSLHQKPIDHHDQHGEEAFNDKSTHQTFKDVDIYTEDFSY